MKKVFENILKIILCIFIFYVDVIIAFSIYQAYVHKSCDNEKLFQNQYIETASGEKFFYCKTESESKETVYFNTFKKEYSYKNVYLYKHYGDYLKNRNSKKCTFAEVQFLPDYRQVSKNHYLYKKLDYRYHKIYEFTDKYYLVKHKGSYGLCDREGKFVIEPKYQRIYLFHNLIMTDTSLHTMDLKKIYSPKFGIINISDDDMLWVQTEGKDRYLNEKGETVWESSEIRVWTYYKDLAEGSEIINPENEDRRDNCYRVLVDKKGNIVSEKLSCDESFIMLENGDYVMKREGSFTSLVKFFDYIFMRF